MVIVRLFHGGRSIVMLAALLVGWAIAINLALLVLVHSGAFDWLPDRQTGAGFVRDSEQRVAGALEEYRAGRVAPDDYLVAVTGISDVREGIDVDVLRQGLGPDIRVLGVAGAGAGAASIVDNARPLLDYGLCADVVVIGIAPLQMLDRPDTPTTEVHLPLRDRVRAVVQRYVWLFARRTDVSIFVDLSLTNARAWLFDALDVHLPTTLPAAPWRPMMRLMGAEHYPNSVLRAGVASAGAIGVYDRKAYDRARIAPALVASLIRAFERSGTRVTIVFTPEHSWLRDREPRGVVDHLAKRLRESTKSRNLAVLDLRALVPDRGFVDLSHLNREGSRKFTRILARIIVAPERSKPPLMSESGGEGRCRTQLR